MFLPPATGSQLARQTHHDLQARPASSACCISSARTPARPGTPDRLKRAGKIAKMRGRARERSISSFVSSSSWRPSRRLCRAQQQGLSPPARTRRVNRARGASHC